MKRFAITSINQGENTLIAANDFEKPANVYETFSQTLTFDDVFADSISLSFWKNQDVHCCVTVYEVEIYGCVQNEVEHTNIPPNMLPTSLPTTLSILEHATNLPTKKPTAVLSTSAPTYAQRNSSASYFAGSSSVPSSTPTLEPTNDLPAQQPWIFSRVKLTVGPFVLGWVEMLFIILLLLFFVCNSLQESQRKNRVVRMIEDINNVKI